MDSITAIENLDNNEIQQGGKYGRKNIVSKR